MAHKKGFLVEDIFGSWTSLDRVTLDPKWHFQVGGPSDFDPVVSSISVLVLRDNMLYEIDRFYGNQRGVTSLDFIPSAGIIDLDVLPMTGGVESLNAAVSASILLYEIYKHLGSGTGTKHSKNKGSG